jgi:hypothetical protein
VTAEVIADDLFGVALGVKVRRIYEVAAELDEAIHDLLGFLDARAPAEVFTESHRTEAERAHPEPRATERHITVERHGISLPFLLNSFKIRLIQPAISSD